MTFCKATQSNNGVAFSVSNLLGNFISFFDKRDVLQRAFSTRSRKTISQPTAVTIMKKPPNSEVRSDRSGGLIQHSRPAMITTNKITRNESFDRLDRSVAFSETLRQNTVLFIVRRPTVIPPVQFPWVWVLAR